MAYSYIRFSSPEQRRGDSLRRQLSASEAYAAEHSLTLDTSLRDEGVSAWRGLHRIKGALGSFYRRVEDGTVQKGSYLLVESLDRLSREEVIDALESFLTLIQAGVVIVTMADKQVYSREEFSRDWTRLIMSLVIMARAAEENALRSQRGRAFWEAKRQACGERKLTLWCPSWLTPVGDPVTHYDLIADRADTVREIFALCIAGIGKERTVALLNSRGVPPFRYERRPTQVSAGWQISSVAKILNNPAAYGAFQPCKTVEREGKSTARVPEGPLIDGYFPAAISRVTFHQAVAARKGRTSNGGRRGKLFSNLFIGIATCDECGGKLKYKESGKRRVTSTAPISYLVCDNALRRLGCDNRMHYNYPDVETRVLHNFFDFVAYHQVRPEDDAATDKLALKVLKSEQAISEQRERFTALARVGLIGPEFVSTMHSFERELAEARKVYAELQQQLTVARSKLPSSTRAAMLDAARGNLTSQNDETKYRARVYVSECLRKEVQCMRFGADRRFTIDLRLFAAIFDLNNRGDTFEIISNSRDITAEIVTESAA